MRNYRKKRLCACRPPGSRPFSRGVLGIPRGKICKDETPEAAIVREIREELCAEVIVKRRLGSVTHSYPDKTVTLVPFVCDGSSADFRITEHDEILWVVPIEAKTLAWLPPDAEILDIYLKKPKDDR